MWVVILAILIVFAFFYVFWRIIWAISKPLVVFIYQSIVKALKSTGITEEVAKAVVSGGALLLILFILVCCF